MDKKKTKFIWILLGAFVFVSMFVFFVLRHPMYIYDADDWLYIVRVRLGVPIWGYWNPTRVLPEVLMPLTAEMGVDLIYPFTHDYTGSIAIATGVLLATLITVYILLFARFLKKEHNISIGIVALSVPTLLMLHFLPFFSEYFYYSHMFFAHDVCCVFYYVIPALLNAILVFILWNNREFEWKNKKNIVKNSLLILLIYLCIFSNLFQSIIATSFVCTILGENLLAKVILDKGDKFKGKTIKYVKSNITLLISLIVWLVSLVFEASGGRADYAEKDFGSNLKNAISIFAYAITKFNRLFYLVFAGIIFVALIIFVVSVVKAKKNKQGIDLIERKYITNVLRCVTSLVITLVFLLLLCGSVGCGYINRQSVLFGILFFAFMLLIESLGYILERFPYFALIIPVVTFVLMSEVVVTRTNYADIYNPVISKNVNEDIINQVLEAQDNGMNEVTVYYPDNGSALWPFDYYRSGERIANALYDHGITKEYINIHLEPSEEKARIFGTN